MERLSDVPTQSRLTYPVINMKKIVVIVLLLTLQFGFSQATTTKVPAEDVDYELSYSPETVDVKPEFPGGIPAFYKFIAKNFTQPESEKFRGGKIVVNFFIEKDGTLKIIKVEGVGFGTEEEATRVFMKSPKWKPAILNDKPVKCSYAFPITLQGN